LAGISVSLIGKKSGTLYFMVEKPDFAVYYSADEESLLKHAQPFSVEDCPQISTDDYSLISPSLKAF
jgi:hypothetical protein